jgi:hypothetical protein
VREISIFKFRFSIGASRASRRAGGFTLLEAILYCVLLSVVMFVSTQLFHSAAGVMRGGSVGAAARREADEVTKAMRADVWEAAEIAVGDPSTALLRQAGGRSVVWRVDAKEQAIERTGYSDVKIVEQRRWPLRGAMVVMEPEGTRGDALVVERSGGEIGKPERVRMHSEVIVLTGRGR